MSHGTINVGLIGCGTVGGGVVSLLQTQADQYAARCGHRLNIKRVLVRNIEKAKSAAPEIASALTTDPDELLGDDEISIIIEVAGGVEPIGDYVVRALEAGKHVVTANKSLLAAKGPSLFALARQNNVSIAFEASCGGGIPIITALKFGLMANRIDGLYGILNGTCNYILTEMTQKGKTYATALAEAQEAGFAEADPTLDVSGMDAAQKLTILASLAYGLKIEEQQVTNVGIDNLSLSDIKFGDEMGYDIKLLAIAERTDSGVALGVEPCFIGKGDMIASVHGSFNALSVYGNATGHTMYYGRGAGQMPTASAVVSDVLNVASGWYPEAFRDMAIWPDQQDPTTPADPHALNSRYYLRIDVLDGAGMMAKVATILGEGDISISAVMQHEANGQYAPVVILTHAAKRGAIEEAASKIEALDVIRERPTVLRIVDFPAG